MDKKFIISNKISIQQAIEVLNDNYHDSATLLVVDDRGAMVGTITDGDIRRGILAGIKTSERVDTLMHKNFHYMSVDNIDINGLRRLRELGIKIIPILDNQNHIIDIVNLIEKKSLLSIDAVIMAGGKGERLRPLTDKVPKPLLPIGNKAIIDHNVDRLITYGVKNISVTVNYLAEQIEEHYRKPHNDVQVQCVREPKFLGTMGAVQFVPKFYNDVVLVMNSDLFTDIDFEDMYMHFIENNADMSVAAIPYNVSIPLGIFELEGRNIKRVLEKPVYNYYANAYCLLQA